MELRKQRNNYNAELKTTRTEFYKNKIINSMQEPKALFQTLGKLSGTTKQQILPNFDSNEVIAEELSNFYINKIANIRTDIERSQQNRSSEMFMPTISTSIRFDAFTEVSLQEMKTIIQSMKKKSSQLDPAPAFIVFNFIDLLLPILLHITNTIIKQQTFPPNLKHAYIRPSVKNPKKDRNDLSNLRPINELPFVSKIVERVLYNQLESYLEENNLHATYQSAYRRFNSCETAMIRVGDEIQQHLLNKKYVALLMLDNSSAFDTVDHTILISKLKTHFHLGSGAVALITSYLEQRSFSVVLQEVRSTPKPLHHGVPQGSLLGPLIYIMYTKDIEVIAEKHNMHINLYADDAQFYVSFELENLEKVQKNLLNCLSDIKIYMSSNFLKLNTDKTELKLFKPDKANLNFEINYDETLLNSSEQIKLLGITITNNLDFTKFIAKKVQSCNFKLRNLYFIRNSLPIKIRITMVKYLILSTLDYCNSILACETETAIKPLQLVLNRAIRFIFNINIRSHITPYLQQLHILPIKYRIKYKICLISFQIFYKMAPRYLTMKFNQYIPSSSMNLRIGPGRDTFMFEFSTSDRRRPTILNKFKQEWNALPLTIRTTPTIENFKIKLKTHFFRIAFL